jgi:hypothetical protein
VKAVLKAEYPIGSFYKKKMKFLWLTDIHLDHCEHQTKLEFYDKLGESDAEAIVISGDIADGQAASKYLHEISMCTPALIYWVLGNHDCFGLSLGEAEELSRSMGGNGSLRYLGGELRPVSLGHRTALIGINGWANGRADDFFRNPWGLQFADIEWINDFRAFQQSDGDEAMRRSHTLMTELGTKSARRAEILVEQAFKKNNHVILVTHAPPFPRCCLFQNKLQAFNVTPLYCNSALGDRLGGLMLKHKDKKMTVLCGHTHSGWREKILPNLTCYVGHARYEHPTIQETFIVK